jgi:hypothetical protein
VLTAIAMLVVLLPGTSNPRDKALGVFDQHTRMVWRAIVTGREIASKLLDAADAIVLRLDSFATD